MLAQVPHNTVIQGHVLDKLRELPNDCIDVVVTSTPYYGLRDYGPDCISIWNAKLDCEHDWQEQKQTLQHENRNNLEGTQEECCNKTGTTFIKKYDDKKSGYCSKCGAWKGQLGLEPHPSMFIEHLSQVFLETKRVLKPSGSLWLNLGDTYYGSGNGQKQSEKGKWTEGEFEQARKAKDFIPNKKQSNWLQPKQKLLIPARVAIALQDQGWILRNEIVWHKVNHMPESCRDRLTRSYESLFFFVKSDKYYFDLDAIRKPLTNSTIDRVQRPYKNKQKFIGDNMSNTRAQTWADKIVKEGNHHGSSIGNRAVYYEDQQVNSSLSGANPGDVWSLTNEGLKEEHFAAFPQKLVKRILECSTPKEICNKCGLPKIRLTEKTTEPRKRVERKILEAVNPSPTSIFRNNLDHVNTFTVGWSSCNCNQGFHSALVFDPFAGSGTVLLVAHKMGFDWSGIEIVPKYCDIIEKRITRHGRVRLDGFMEDA